MRFGGNDAAEEKRSQCCQLEYAMSGGRQ